MSTHTGPTDGRNNHQEARTRFFKKRPSEWTRKERIQFAVPVIVAIAAIAIPLIVTRGSGDGGGGGSDGGGGGSQSIKPPSGTYRTHVGRALTLTNGISSLTIRLTRIVDPANGDSNFLNSGDRYLAAEFRVSNRSSQALNGLKIFDSYTTVIGSNGQTYSADELNTVSECTSFHNGPDQIVSGESVTGCAVFQIPTGVSASEVQVTAGNERGIWSNR
jgi:hypothetical protein